MSINLKNFEEATKSYERLKSIISEIKNICLGNIFKKIKWQ